MSFLDRLVGVIAPFGCLSCGRQGKLLCAECSREKLPVMGPVCYRCGRLEPFGLPCPACRATSPLDYVWIRAEYKGLAKKLVHRFKFGLAQSAASDIAKACLGVLPHIPEDTIFCHIPAANSRVRQRGFDQSLLIARQIAKLNGRQQQTLLARIGQTRQLGANRSKRLEQTKSNFRIVRPARIKGARIVLVDDVLTTGATLDAAAKCLKSAGAKWVSAVVFARTN